MDESGNICRTNGGNHTEEQLVSCLVLTFTTVQDLAGSWFFVMQVTFKAAEVMIRQ